jgi:hypothetical protein
VTNVSRVGPFNASSVWVLPVSDPTYAPEHHWERDGWAVGALQAADMFELPDPWRPGER